MNEPRIIRKRKDLEEARDSEPVEHCIVYTSAFKNTGLLQHALKYAYWGILQGGKLEIVDDGPCSDYIAPWKFPFSLVKMQSLQCLGDGCSVDSIDEEKFTIILTRTAARLSDDWNAGIIFGGAEEELLILEKSLNALCKQKKLQGPDKIFVCGPRKEPALLSCFKNITYVTYEDDNPRFSISKKKNYLISCFNSPKFVVLHARIVLAEDALDNVPREFDIAGPKVSVIEGSRSVSYIGVAAIDRKLPYVRPTMTVRSTRQSVNPVDYLKSRNLFVDGGVFFATRSVFEKCPLNEALCWGDAEDIEWCFRAKASGILVDFWPDVKAHSQTNKLGVRPILSGRFLRYASILRLKIQWLVNGLIYLLKKIRRNG